MQRYHIRLSLLISCLWSAPLLALPDQNFMSFWHGIFRNPAQVGAIAPCSSFVAEEISKHIDTVAHQNPGESNEPIHILEVGGGCGALTRDIEKKLNGIDTAYVLDVVEIDPEYCEILSKKFGGNPRINICCVDVTTWNPPYQYDIVISSLPFTSLPTSLVISVVDQFKKLTKKGGFISYLEYIFLARLKQTFLVGNSKKEFETKISVLYDFKQEFCIETARVWLNVMPAQIHHLKII